MKYRDKEPKKEFKFISFLNEKSLANLNEIAKQGGIKYSKKHIKKPIEEKINYKKLMEIPPGDKRGEE